MWLKEFFKEKQFEREHPGTLVVGDYKVRFNQEWQGTEIGWVENKQLHGYGICVLNKDKTEYEPMPSEVNGIPVVSAHSAFYGCRNLSKPPLLPEGLKSLERTFEDCDKLTEAPTIPKTVQNMEFTFAKCKGLINPPEIPDGVKTMYATFWNCSSLETLPDIPDSVKQTGYVFEGCPKDTLADTLLSDNAPVNTDFTTDIDEKTQDSHEEL